MKRKGMWADFTAEDIEIMLTLRREAEERTRKAAEKAVHPKRSTRARTTAPAPDRKTKSKNKAETDGGSPSRKE